MVGPAGGAGPDAGADLGGGACPDPDPGCFWILIFVFPGLIPKT